MADQPFCRQHDVGTGTVIAIEGVYIGGGEFLCEFRDVANIGSPEGVECLVVIADRPKPGAVIDEMIDEPNLTRIDVLVFIDEHMIIALVIELRYDSFAFIALTTSGTISAKSIAPASRNAC